MAYQLQKPLEEYNINQLGALYNDIARTEGLPPRSAPFPDKETAINMVNGMLTQANAPGDAGTPKVRKARRIVTNAEMFRVNDLLKVHCLPTGESTPDGAKVHKYEEGWSDNRVATEISTDFPETTVSRVRREVYGPLIGSSEKKEEKKNRITALEAKVTELETRVSALEV